MGMASPCKVRLLLWKGLAAEGGGETLPEPGGPALAARRGGLFGSLHVSVLFAQRPQVLPPIGVSRHKGPAGAHTVGLRVVNAAGRRARFGQSLGVVDQQAARLDDRSVRRPRRSRLRSTIGPWLIVIARSSMPMAGMPMKPRTVCLSVR